MKELLEFLDIAIILLAPLCYNISIQVAASETLKQAGCTVQADANQPEPARTVTYLYTDIEGSTRLWEQMPVAMQASQALHHSILRAGTESHHGHVFQIRDDAFCASFWTVIDGIMI